MYYSNQFFVGGPPLRPCFGKLCDSNESLNHRRFQHSLSFFIGVKGVANNAECTAHAVLPFSHARFKAVCSNSLIADFFQWRKRQVVQRVAGLRLRRITLAR